MCIVAYRISGILGPCFDSAPGISALSACSCTLSSLRDIDRSRALRGHVGAATIVQSYPVGDRLVTSSPPPPLALLASGHEWLARSLESVLSSDGYAVLHAYTPAQAIDRTVTVQPDLIFVAFDLDLAGPGVEFCLELSARGVASGIPLFLVTSRPVSRRERLEALHAGVWEVITFPLDTEAFMLQLERYVQLRLGIRRSREEGLIDPQTGLYNMRGMLRRVREEGAVAKRHRLPMSCLVLGPGVAVEGARSGARSRAPEFPALSIARLLREGCREGDIVGRLGPRDFAVLAPATDPSGGQAMARRITAGLEAALAETGPEVGEAGVRAGLCAVPDFAVAAIQPIELLVRATVALRRSRSVPGAALVYSY